MGSRKTLLFIAVFVVGAIAALVETHSASNRRVQLVDPASIGAPLPPPLHVGSTSSREPASAATPTPPAPLFPTAPSVASQNDLIAAPAATTSKDTTDRNADLRSSQERLNAIDSLEQDAERLFSTPTLPRDFGSWSTNQQGLEQLDYQTPDGNITSWFSPDGSGGSAVRAQEAQLANGEVVDRWFGETGNVEQIMHQYDRDNSYSVYYYPTGEIEATRVVRNGDEIFTKYDRDGRQIERTQTPASQP